MKAVYKKDLKSAFTGMIGWVLCAFVVVVVGLYFTAICLQSGYADFSLVLYNTTFIFLVVVPLLTMRSIVEERRQKTDQLLLTSRASIAGIVWGKYLALVTVYAIPLAIVGICPLVMRAYGSVSLARSYAALLALETRYCRQEPYLSLGRYIHVTALKSQAHSRRCKDKV